MKHFRPEPPPPGPLPAWVIYDHPADVPDAFVARLWLGSEPTLEIILADTLEAARSAVHLRGGRHWVPRFEVDDPAIVEVWL